jgi:hypothetical protein
MNILVEKYIQEFVNGIKNFNYKDNGMFNNEIYIVYLLYKELNCDLFVESGIDNGVSTEKFLHLIDDEYIGIDINQHCYGSKVKKNNFQFICGNSMNILKNIVNEKNKNIFAMIDGPKNHDAIKLKNELLDNDKVKIVALHDTYDGLENEDYLRVFETKNNSEYSKKYFDILNFRDKNDIVTIYNKNIDALGKTYYTIYPTGPGVSIYSKEKLNFIL